MKEKSLQELQAELFTIQQRIKKITPYDSHVDAVAQSFHLGFVGGSGRNTYRLNKRKEAYLDRTIKAAVIISDLNKQENYILSQIRKIEQTEADILSGEAERKAAARKQKIENLATYWRLLKVGDELPIGNPNGNPNITKKNTKSCETGIGCKWQAWEIIGKEAAALL